MQSNSNQPNPEFSQPNSETQKHHQPVQFSNPVFPLSNVSTTPSILSGVDNQQPHSLLTNAVVQSMLDKQKDQYNPDIFRNINLQQISQQGTPNVPRNPNIYPWSNPFPVIQHPSSIFNPSISIYNPSIYNPLNYNPSIYNPSIYNPSIYLPLKSEYLAFFNDDDELIQKVKKQSNQDLLSINIEIKAQHNIGPLNHAQTIPAICSLKTKGTHRPNVDLICAIDISGSMSGKKIKLVQSTLKYLLGELHEDDRLCLITFNDKAQRLCTLLKNNVDGKVKLQKLIMSGLIATGGTNIMSGINLALRMIAQRRYKNPVTSIFLLSDGQDSAALKTFKSRIKKDKKNQHIFSLHCFGFGDDHDPQLMTEFAKLKDGNFYYIQELSTLDEAFVNALGGLFSVVAQKLKIMIQTCTKGKFSEIKINRTYGPMWQNKNEVYTIELGQVASQINKDFVFEIDIPAFKFQLGDSERNQKIIDALFEAEDNDGKVFNGKTELRFTFFNAKQEIVRQSQTQKSSKTIQESKQARSQKLVKPRPSRESTQKQERKSSR